MTTYIDSVKTNRAYVGNFIVKIGSDYFGVSQPDSGLTLDADKVGVISGIKVNPIKIDLQKVSQPINATTFQLHDSSGNITKLLKDNAGLLLNKPIEIWLGRINESMAFADYLKLEDMTTTDVAYANNVYTFQARDIREQMNVEIFDTETTLAVDILAATTTITVADTTNFPTSGKFKLNDEFISYTGKTATTFTGCVRADPGEAVDHDGGSAVYKVDEITDNPINILLQILISGGGGGIYDVLSEGLGIDPTKIDVTRFESLRDNVFSGESYFYRMVNSGKILKFIEKELLSSTNTRFTLSDDGKLSLALLDQATFDDVATKDMSESSITAVSSWKANIKDVSNIIRINWDFNDVSGVYEKATEFRDTDSITEFGEQPILEFSWRGISDLAIVNDRGSRMAARFSTPNPRITLRTHIDKSLLNVGDKVAVTSREIPSANGTLLFNDTLEVLSRSIDHTNGQATFELVYTTYNGIRVAYIAPCLAVFSITSQSVFDVPAGTGVQLEVGYKLVLYDKVANVFEADPVNAILSISGDTVTMENAWATTLDTGKHAIRFAEYPDVTDRQKRFGFIGIAGGGDFPSDGTSSYKIGI